MASDGGGGLLDGEEGWGRRAGTFSDYAPMSTSPQPQLQMLTSSAPGLDRDHSSYGTGGKWKGSRKGGRRPAVPYERPVRQAPTDPQVAGCLDVTSAQALAGHGRRRDWLKSGISKILATSATYLYSSLFRRRLPEPESVSDAEGQLADAKDPVSSPSADADMPAGNGQVGFSEKLEHRDVEVPDSSPPDLERLLKKKTLSRDEFECLTALLQARVVSHGVERKQQPKQVEVGVRASQHESQPSGSNQSEAQRWRQDLQKAREERDNGVRALTVYENGGPSAGALGAAEGLDAMGSSPVDVAIAFMGGRSSRQTGSTSPLEPLGQRDENRLAIGQTPHVPQMTLAKISNPDLSNEDLFRTPPPPSVQSWGRNRLPSRTPYSRPLRLQSPRERAVDGTFGTPSMTRWTPIRTPVTGGREMLKRRSTVLEDGGPSGGPIRRTRQKAILSSSLMQSRGSPFPITPVTGSSLLTLPASLGGKLGGASPFQKDVTARDSVTASGNFYVPAQSSETARRILETLEKMTPSPKGKLLGEELAHVRDKPPTPLTEGMLNEQARKSMTVVDHSLPSESREPGPSGRSMVNESPTSGFSTAFGSAVKTLDYNIKSKGKGKASLLPSENGASGQSGLQATQERTGTVDRIVEEPSTRPKVSDSVRASENDRSKGFRMNAVLEESGSEDESRLGKKSFSSTPPPMATPKVSSTAPASSAVASPVFGTPTYSPTASPIPGLSSSLNNTQAAEPSKGAGFTFPTRASLEGPPTPKAMSPATSSSKAAPATPFFSFAQGVEPLSSSGLPGEQNSLAANVDSQTDIKAEFSFGPPSTLIAPAVKPLPKLQPIFDSKVPSLSKQSPLFGALSSPATVMLPAVTSAGATSSTQADSNWTTPSTASIKASALSSSTFAFSSSASSSIFGSGSAMIASAAAPSVSMFASNGGSGTAPTTSLFASNSAAGTTSPLSGGISGFGQPIPLASKIPPSTLRASGASESQVSMTKDNSTPVLDLERPQKRSSPSLQQDPIKKQPPLPTVPSHSFTTFGTGVGNSASNSTLPVSFGASSAATSQAPFLLPSFGQASTSAPQASPALPSTGPIPFTFGSPLPTATSSTSASTLPSFHSTPSFPSFPSFSSAPTGSAFGVSPAAPIAFGSTPTTTPFGSTAVKSVFGGFGSETVSQSPPTAVFGSGFTSSPSTTTAFPFGASTGFAFGAGAASSSSGAGFTFGSSASFSFAGNKGSPTPAQSSIFGLSNSVPAFGSTTNGAMASDVVNDQSNMDDNSMAEEPPQMGGSVLPQPSLFGAQSSATTGSFVFGVQPGAPVAGGPSLFVGFPAQTNPPGFAATANPFAAPQQPTGSLDFAGGAFTLGSGGDKPTRKIFKAKRTGAKRGK